jgi:DNA-binding NarL/FixJ family response regulator
MARSKKTVVIADDHDIVRRGVRELIEQRAGLRVVGEADTIPGALQVVDDVEPDLVVLDVQFPDGSGVEACREIKDRHPDMAVLMLTAYADEQAYVSAVLAGAAGYLLKRIDADELVDAVTRAANGENVLDEEFSERLLDRASSGDRGDPLLSRLSPQELRVLELIAQGRTNRQIADEIFLAHKTVKNYVSNLLAKLEMNNRSEAAAYAARLAVLRAAEEEDDDGDEAGLDTGEEPSA